MTTAALAAAAFNASPAFADSNTLYVGGAGCSDAGSGTQAQPYCTITAAAKAAVAGKTVLVAPGTYTEQVTVPKSGTSGSPIVFRSAVQGAAKITGGLSGFAVSGRSYVTIDGFTVTGTTGVGISLSGGTNLLVTNNTVTYAGQPVSGKTAIGVDVYNVTDSQLTGNTSDHNSFHGFRVSGTSTRVTLTGNEASFNAQGYQRNANGIDIIAAGNTAIGNVLHDNEDSGLQFYTGGDSGTAANNVIYRNGDHGIDDLNVKGGVLTGNTVFNNCTDGINIEGTSGNYRVENNVSVDNATNTACAHGPVGRDGSGRAGDIGLYDSAPSGSSVDYNQVSLTGGTGKIYQWGSTGYTSLAAFHAATGQGTHDIQANPQFVNAAGGDFHLSAGSRAIDSADSGATAAQAADVQGNARADDAATANTGVGSRSYDDRGAYEFQPSGSTGTAPTAALSVANGAAALSVTADASASVAGSTAIASYNFNYGDGTSSGTQASATASHTYATAGTYNVTVTVTDVDGLSATKTAPITVTAPVQTPPTAALSLTNGAAALSVNADASASAAGSTAIASYSFNYGDGASSGAQASATASHTYAAAGTYNVTVTVTDVDGLSATKTAPITVTAPVQTPPTAALTVSTGATALSVNADASASAAGSTAIASYNFNYGDGTSSGAQPTSTATHTYAAAGTYNVTVTVTDVDGLSSTKTAPITVTAPVQTPPTAALTVSTGATALSVNADASASTAGSTAIASYNFNYGDGASSGAQPTSTATHTYAAAGTYNVTVTVTDVDGLSATKTAPITVTSQTAPITYVGRDAAVALTATGTSVTVPITRASQAGDALMVSVMLTGTTPGLFTATDSRGNVYHYSAGSDVFDASKHRTLVLAAYNTKALSTADSITLTFPNSSKYNVEVDEFSGIGALDQQTTASGPSGGTTFGTGPVTTTTGNELLFTAVGTNSGTAAGFAAGWNGLPPVANSSYRLNCAWRIVSNTGSYTSSGTTTSQWANVLDTFD